MAKKTTTTAQPVAIWRASMTTDHFDFEAYGATEKTARAALARGCKTHAAQCDLSRDWWHAYDVECQPFAIGECYRDRSPMQPREAGQ